MFKKVFRSSFLSLFTAGLMVLCLFSGPAQAAEKTTIGREDHSFVEMPEYSRPSPPGINAVTGILVELNSGVILYSKNINQRMYPASITKIMTSLLAIENLDFSEKIEISYNASHDLISGGFDWRFKEGQVFTTEEALFGLCLNSVNTLGYALAEKMDGSVDAFAVRMNERAAELGALNTTFTNPHGLNDTRHLTTAYDMAKILWGAIELDDYRRIAGTDEYYLAADETRIEMTYSHTIRFLHSDNSLYDSRVICGKTGWTEDAGFTRAIYASDGKLDLICVIFCSDSADTAETDVKALLDYGFNNFSLVEIPDFGGNVVMEGQVQDEDGQNRIVTFSAGSGKSLTGAACLVPNDYAMRTWNLNLYTEQGSRVVRGRASLGGVALAEYPVTMNLVSEETKAVYPTDPPTESAPESEPRGSENESQASTAGQQTPPETRAPESQPQNSDKAFPLSGGMLWLVSGIVALVMLLCLVAIFILIQQNKRLKKRVERRKNVRPEL